MIALGGAIGTGLFLRIVSRDSTCWSFHPSGVSGWWNHCVSHCPRPRRDVGYCGTGIGGIFVLCIQALESPGWFRRGVELLVHIHCGCDGGTGGGPAGSSTTGYPACQSGWPAAFFLVVITATNLASVKVFGETEFWLSLIKVLAVVGMIVLVW